MIKVVNKRTFVGEHGNFIGRGSPLGNDWSHKEGTKAKYVVATVEEAIQEYEKDLRKKIAEEDQAICSELNRLYKYYKKNKELNLICYCKWKGDEPCHGDIIKNILEEVLLNQS